MNDYITWIVKAATKMPDKIIKNENGDKIIDKFNGYDNDLGENIRRKEYFKCNIKKIRNDGSVVCRSTSKVSHKIIFEGEKSKKQGYILLDVDGKINQGESINGKEKEWHTKNAMKLERNGIISYWVGGIEADKKKYDAAVAFDKLI